MQSNFYRAKLFNILKALGVFFIAAIPLGLHLAAFVFLPSFHRFCRAALDSYWTHHIADSGVTVGLVYYGAVVFILWRTRWTSWRAFSEIMQSFEETIEKAFSRPFFKPSEKQQVASAEV